MCSYRALVLASFESSNCQQSTRERTKQEEKRGPKYTTSNEYKQKPSAMPFAKRLAKEQLPFDIKKKELTFIAKQLLVGG